MISAGNDNMVDTSSESPHLTVLFLQCINPLKNIDYRNGIITIKKLKILYFDDFDALHKFGITATFGYGNFLGSSMFMIIHYFNIFVDNKMTYFIRIVKAGLMVSKTLQNSPKIIMFEKYPWGIILPSCIQTYLDEFYF